MSTDSRPPLTPETLATWTDQEVVEEWRKTSWLTADPKLSALADEIQRRDLNF